MQYVMFLYPAVQPTTLFLIKLCEDIPWNRHHMYVENKYKQMHKAY